MTKEWEHDYYQTSPAQTSPAQTSLAAAGKRLFAASLQTASSKWTIFVSVGYDGTELKVFMGPEERIEQLKAQVAAEIGEVGKLFRVETGGELLDDQTLVSCLTDEALVWLQPIDELTQTKGALIAIRDANVSIVANKPGWGNLETFVEMEELAQCEGVTVEDGHVTQLDFKYWGLTGEK